MKLNVIQRVSVSSACGKIMRATLPARQARCEATTEADRLIEYRAIAAIAGAGVSCRTSSTVKTALMLI
jgi:hypothetical protein